MTPDWECSRCDTAHGSNPRSCLECGHTVFEPVEPRGWRSRAHDFFSELLGST